MPRPPLNHFCSRKPKRNRISISLFLTSFLWRLSIQHHLNPPRFRSSIDKHIAVISINPPFYSLDLHFVFRVSQPKVRITHFLTTRHKKSRDELFSNQLFCGGLSPLLKLPIIHNADTTSIEFCICRCRQHAGSQPERGWRSWW